MTRSLLELKPTLRLDLGGGDYLRPIDAGDVTQAYVDGLNDPEVHRYMEAPRKQRQTLDSIRSYVAANTADPYAVLFGLYCGGTLRGTVRLHDLDTVNRRATLGIALFDRRVWGRGLASRAIAAVTAFAAAELAVERLEAGIIEANAASVAAFEKAGFRRGGSKEADSELGPVGLWIHEAGQGAARGRG
jgi:RimJ/RimL family protein N-acetyltransferase